MSNEAIETSTAPTTNTGTTHSVKAGRLDLGDAVDNLLIDLNAPSKEDKPEESDEVTAAKAAQKSNSEDKFMDAIDGAEDILEPEAEAVEAAEEEEEELATDETEVEAQESNEEPEATEEEAEADDEVVLFTTPDGSDVTLEELKSGYLRQSDYTKKTQELAANRQQLGQNYEAFSQQQDVLAQNLELALNVVEPQLAQFATLDWDSLAASDAYEYAEKRALYDQAQSRYSQIMTAAQATVAQGNARKQQAEQHRLAAERQSLQMALPDMADPVKGRKLATSIKEYAMTMGLSDSEASNIVDHRMIVMLDKARKYDEISTTKLTAAQKKLKKGPRKMVTGGKPTSKQQRSNSEKAKLRSKLAKSGSVDDGVDWLLSS